MNAFDSLFWEWFVLVSVIFLFVLIDQFSLITLFFGMALIGFGLLKLAQENNRKVDRRLLERAKSI